MEYNNENTTQNNKTNSGYSENPLTELLGVLVFFVVMIIIMLVLLHFRG